MTIHGAVTPRECRNSTEKSAATGGGTKRRFGAVTTDDPRAPAIAPPTSTSAEAENWPRGGCTAWAEPQPGTQRPPAAWSRNG